MNARSPSNILIETLRLLASDAETQLSVLPKWVMAADELALTFHDAVLLATSNPQRLGLAVDQLEALKQIDEDLGQRRDGEFWSNKGLREDAAWEAIRARAKGILGSLRVPYERPELEWIQFVR